MVQLRHLIFLVSMICLTLIFANSLLLNFTIICMEPNDASNKNNDSTSSESSSFFSPMQRSALFSATAIGAIVGGIPINKLIGRFTLRRTITGYGLLSALSTLATPFLHYLFGFPALLVTRILQGTAFPAEYVTNSMVTRKWATLNSAGTFLMLISSHFQLGPLLTMPAAGYFCESSWGWQGIYYVQGGLTLAFFALFYIIFRDTPTEHPWISHQELAQIQCGKRISLVTCKEDGTIMPRNVPYKAILSDWAVWLLLLAFFSDEVGFQIYTQLGPYYLNKVIGIGVAGTGLFAALPYAVSMVTKLLGGPINDLLLSRCLSEKARIKLFAGISQYGIAFCFLGLAFIPLFTHSLWLIMPFYATMNMFTGLDFLGVIRCSQTMSLRHSELISAWEAILSSIIALVLPAIVNAVAPDDSLEQWMRVLLAIALILILCITSFIVFGKTTPRKWALIDFGTTNVVTDISSNGKIHNKL